MKSKIYKTECLKIGQLFTIGGDMPIANTYLIIASSQFGEGQKTEVN